MKKIIEPIENFFRKVEEFSKQTKFILRIFSAFQKGIKAFNDELFERNNKQVSE